MMSGMEHVGKQARPKRTRKRGYIGQKYDLKKSALATSFQGMENERKAENSLLVFKEWRTSERQRIQDLYSKEATMGYLEMRSSLHLFLLLRSK